jgi:hypothetical protein
MLQDTSADDPVQIVVSKREAVSVSNESDVRESVDIHCDHRRTPPPTTRPQIEDYGFVAKVSNHPPNAGVLIGIVACPTRGSRADKHAEHDTPPSSCPSRSRIDLPSSGQKSS